VFLISRARRLHAAAIDSRLGPIRDIDALILTRDGAGQDAMQMLKGSPRAMSSAMHRIPGVMGKLPGLLR
jgi:hypothetical protein